MATVSVLASSWGYVHHTLFDSIDLDAVAVAHQPQLRHACFAPTYHSFSILSTAQHPPDLLSGLFTWFRHESWHPCRTLRRCVFRRFFSEHLFTLLFQTRPSMLDWLKHCLQNVLGLELDPISYLGARRLVRAWCALGARLMP